jgi:hypothetical protein
MELLQSHTQIADIIGVLGSLLLIMAFTRCVLSEKFRDGGQFLWLNMVGSILLLPSAHVHQSSAAFSICAFWIIASIAALVNKNRLSAIVLYPMSVTFTIFATLSIANLWLSEQEHFVAKIVSLVAVETFVVSYALFIGRMIPGKWYFAATFVGNALFIPCLYIENNVASLVLQSFCLLLSLYGLIQKETISIEVTKPT